MFAYAYVVTIPSWVNEKKPEVGVNSAIWVPATVGLFMKIASGLLGAWVSEAVTQNSDPGYPTHSSGSARPWHRALVARRSQ